MNWRSSNDEQLEADATALIMGPAGMMILQMRPVAYWLWWPHEAAKRHAWSTSWNVTATVRRTTTTECGFKNGGHHAKSTLGHRHQARAQRTIWARGATATFAP